MCSTGTSWTLRVSLCNSIVDRNSLCMEPTQQHKFTRKLTYKKLLLTPTSEVYMSCQKSTLQAILLLGFTRQHYLELESVLLASKT